MAKNMRFAHGDRLSLPVASGVASGVAVRVGSLVGVAMTDRSREGDASVALSGVYDLPVDGVTTVGSKVYIDGDGGVSSTAAEGSYLFGHALAGKAAAVSVVPVRVSNSPQEG